MLPDSAEGPSSAALSAYQCTYRCVVLPDGHFGMSNHIECICLNAPIGAWCSLTPLWGCLLFCTGMSQCTYRCVVLPDLSVPGMIAIVTTVSMRLQVRGAP